jgi:hypothetical protein
MALGHVARRQVTRIMFPKLYDPHSKYTPKLSQDFMANFYGQCLRPAAMFTDNFAQAGWPTNYEHAMRLIRSERGSLHFKSVDISANDLDVFAEQLLEKMARFPDMEGAFFLHEVRGVKNHGRHELNNLPERMAAFDTCVDILEITKVNIDDWYFDVAVEIQVPESIAFWDTAAFKDVLQLALPSAAEEDVRKLEGKRSFHVDPQSSLDDIGGFRVEPKSQGRVDEVHYIQAYHTLSSSCRTLHHGMFSQHSGLDLMPKKIDKLIHDLEGMAKSLQGNSGSVTEAGLQGNARLEIRVPLRKAFMALPRITDQFVARCIIAHPIPLFW